MCEHADRRDISAAGIGARVSLPLASLREIAFPFPHVCDKLSLPTR
jgi:hypothetical protein